MNRMHSLLSYIHTFTFFFLMEKRQKSCRVCGVLAAMHLFKKSFIPFHSIEQRIFRLCKAGKQQLLYRDFADFASLMTESPHQCGNDWISQQDKAVAHWFLPGPILDRPACSPDLNLIENIWKWMLSNVSKKLQTVDDLRDLQLLNLCNLLLEKIHHFWMMLRILNV